MRIPTISFLTIEDPDQLLLPTTLDEGQVLPGQLTLPQPYWVWRLHGYTVHSHSRATAGLVIVPEVAAVFAERLRDRFDV